MRPSHKTRLMPPEIVPKWLAILEEGAKQPAIVEEFDGNAVAALVEWGNYFQLYDATPKDMASLLIDIDANLADGRVSYVIPKPQKRGSTMMAYVKEDGWETWLADMEGFLTLEESE